MGPFGPSKSSTAITADRYATATALAGSPALEDLTWLYLRWFFGQLDRLYVAPQHRDPLVARGFDPARLEILPTLQGEEELLAAAGAAVAG